MTTAQGDSSIKSSGARDALLKILDDIIDLGPVEALVRSKFESDSPILSEIPEYLLGLGGKRMRPVITLLMARALGMPAASAELVDIAAGIELIHMATLLHDDIIDRSPVRRHKASAFIRYGVPNTLLAGDFLLVRAFSLCARLDRYIIDATEQACIALTEGEAEEVPLYSRRFTVQEVIEIARKKTAALFKLGAESAAFIANGRPEVIAAAAEFGENLGVAFQALDDILDVTSTEDLLGKKSGQDLLERKPSLVNVLWLQSQSSLARRLLDEPSAGGDAAFVEEALVELRGGETVELARGMALSYTSAATAALERCLELAGNADLTAARALRVLIDYTVSRLE